MSLATTQLRHVWRDHSDGNATLRVLALQQWFEAEGWEHEDIVKQGGYWQDVPVVMREDKTFPE